MGIKFYTYLRQYIVLNNIIKSLLAIPIMGENIRMANINDFPAIVSLMAINERVEDVEEEHFCTGALVTSSHILTAAHCLEDTQRDETQIVIGSVDLRSGQIFYPLWWVTYNQWALERHVRLRFASNDIAIIKLSLTVPNDIPPMPISNAENRYLYGLNVITAGWGIKNNGQIARFMETVNLTILSNVQCEDRIALAQGHRIPVPERLLCSVSEPLALMQAGESGSPVIFAGVIIAIQKATVPFPELPFHPLKVNVHTGVKYYRDFITDVLTSNRQWF